MEKMLFDTLNIQFWLCKVNPFPKRQILDSSKLKEIADNNFKFDENGRKFFRWTGNTVGKGEIAHYNNFFFSLGVFKRLVLQTHKIQGLFGKGLSFMPSFK